MAMVLGLAVSLLGATLIVSACHEYATFRHKEVMSSSCPALRLILSCSLVHLCQRLAVQPLIRHHMIVAKALIRLGFVYNKKYFIAQVRMTHAGSKR